jgi:hypothetical protein
MLVQIECLRVGFAAEGTNVNLKFGAKRWRRYTITLYSVLLIAYKFSLAGG